MKFVIFLVFLAAMALLVLWAIYEFAKSEGLFKKKAKYSIDIKELEENKEVVELTTPSGNKHYAGLPYTRGDTIDRELQLEEARRMKKQLRSFK